MKKRRLLSIVLSLCMVLAFMPQMVFAGGADNGYQFKEGTAGTGTAEGPECFIDRDSNTKWCVTNFSGAYIIFSTDSPMNVSGYSITTGNDNESCTGRNPKNWTLYGCDDYTGSGTGTWEEIHSVIKDTILKDENMKTYNFAFDKEETAYQYYKLEITAIKSGDVMQMSEFALTSCDHNWGEPVTTAPTCTSAGNTTKTCNDCKGTDSVYLKPVNHDFTGDGGKCKTCGYTADKLYVDENGISCPINHNATIITDELTVWNNTDANGGWYIAQGDVTIESDVTVSGDIHLILADGCKLTVNNSITGADNSGSSLTIYRQAGGTGTLVVNGDIKGGEGASCLPEDGNGGGGGTITINGGTVNVTNSISGGKGGTGGSQNPLEYYSGGAGGCVNIYGGTVTVTQNITGGKGGGVYTFGNGGAGGCVNIYGGTVTVTQNITGGEGGGNNGAGGDIAISGGVVETGNIKGGNGAVNGSHHEATSGAGGSVSISGGVVEAGSITGGSGGLSLGVVGNGGNVTINGGMVFENSIGKVYGSSVTLSENFTITADKTLTIESGKTLIIPDGVTLTNNGTIENNGTISNSGKIYVDGTFTGTADNLYYPLTVENATATGDISEYNSKNYGKAGSNITLTPDTPPAGYKFGGWDISSSSTVSIGEDNTFTMPKEALTVTAQWKEVILPEIIEGKGQSITAGEKKTLSFTSNADFKEFCEVQLDGKTLDEKNYTVKEGSTIVTLKADYVATLPVGEHTIGIVSESGTATTTFTVAEKSALGTSDDSDIDNSSVKDNDSKTESEDSVKTGDDTNLALWLALMLLSGAGITGVTAYTRRKRTNE